jgi:hypothetical protein
MKAHCPKCGKALDSEKGDFIGLGGSQYCKCGERMEITDE